MLNQALRYEDVLGESKQQFCQMLRTDRCFLRRRTQNRARDEMNGRRELLRVPVAAKVVLLKATHEIKQSICDPLGLIIRSVLLHNFPTKSRVPLTK